MNHLMLGHYKTRQEWCNRKLSKSQFLKMQLSEHDVELHLRCLTKGTLHPCSHIEHRSRINGIFGLGMRIAKPG